MPTYKLTYFNLRGRAEVIRLLFAQAGVEYEDNRIEGQEWPALQTKTPFRGLPILEVDGKVIGQSTAIARLVASQQGLAGKDDLERAQADMVVDTLLDIKVPMMRTHFEKDSTKKEELKKEFVEKTFPKLMGCLEALLKADGYFVGDSVTWADIYMAGSAEQFDMFFQGHSWADKYPKVKALIAKVNALPRIAAWIKTRPQTHL